MIKKFSKTIFYVVVIVVIVLTFWSSVAFVRFMKDAATSSFNKSIIYSDKLTIIYRPSCLRCQKTLPKLFLEHAFDRKGEYVLNAEKLTPNQLDWLESRITPTFYYKKISYDTINQQKIEKIWHASHK